ncbi:CTTNBP2 N-terminal-like protein [Oncorhynchus keta]|uniref:CTTNBP2 N-terminal-like protein n=1 Tax=Oncorhynchus keta TaxID=8018 RepID=UPI0015FBD623|nr:CTTNBP2 N-terminal-like protein [Oncorhynchus keta]
MNMESLSKPELLMLFSVLEGELEARDLVIEALRAQHRDTYVEERYGKYNLSDPFLALQRDSNALGGQSSGFHQAAACFSPLAVLKLVVTHCRKMQEKMLAQLAAAESRQRKAIADLEEERRRHAEDTAEGDDVTCILEKERERLLQQLEFERGQLCRLEKEQKKVLEQLEEERVQHKQLSSALAKECKWASQRALEEGHRLAEAGRRLEKEQGEVLALRAELQEERRRALQMEARVEEQLAEFDTEREQLRSRLKKEDAQYCQLQEQVEALKRELQGERGAEEERREYPVDTSGGSPPPPPHPSQAEGGETEEPKVNGHHDCATEEQVPALPDRLGQDNWSENSSSVLGSPALLTKMISLCSTGTSSVTSSPCSSPQLATSPSYQSSYQVGINHRFHAARHKFQGHTDPEQQQQQQGGGGGGSLPHSPRDLSPTPSPSPEPVSVPVHSPAKQLARSTVTQVLSRFTVQQGAKPPPPNSSPFGTDYRNLAPSSPVIPRASGAALPLGVRSPTIPRAERGNPPPIPPKKPALAQSPASPIPGTRANHFPELSGSCGLTRCQENVKELDMVVSSTS